MYLRVKKKGRRHAFYLVVSRRVRGKPRQSTVAYLGSLTTDDIRFSALYSEKFRLCHADIVKLEQAVNSMTRFWNNAVSKVRRIDVMAARQPMTQLANWISPEVLAPGNPYLMFSLPMMLEAEGSNHTWRRRKRRSEQL
jgi:hypothetical protein